MTDTEIIIYTECRDCGTELDEPTDERGCDYCAKCADDTIEAYDLAGDR